ncbi:MAG TPA: GntR family transcriptional regulator [Afipia sp.]
MEEKLNKSAKKAAKKKPIRHPLSKEDLKILNAHSSRIPTAKLAKPIKRSGRSLSKEIPSLLPVAPVDRQSMHTVVADRLREAILGGSLPPGARLIEVDLAARLSVSRGTVRAGLQRLVSEGLVVLKAYTGWHVLKLEARDALELYTLRGCMEPLASRLAAEKIDDAGRTLLMQAFKRLKTAVRESDDRTITDADLTIHTTIVGLAGHQRLSVHYELVEQQLRIYIASSNAMLRKRTIVIENHQELVEAICKGDAERAEMLARTHGASAAKDLFSVLETNKENSTDSLLKSNTQRKNIARKMLDEA